MTNKKVNIRNSINIDLFSFYFSAFLTDIKLCKVIIITVYWVCNIYGRSNMFNNYSTKGGSIKELSNSTISIPHWN